MSSSSSSPSSSSSSSPSSSSSSNSSYWPSSSSSYSPTSSWSSVVSSSSSSNPNITYDIGVLKTGFKLLNGGVSEFWRYAVATISPKDKVNDVTFSWPWSTYATFNEISRDASSGKIMIGFGGRQETAPSTTYELKATLDGQDFPLEVRVVIPKDFDYAPDSTSPYPNNVVNVARNASEVFSVFGQAYIAAGPSLISQTLSLLKFTIKDQYGSTLDSLYDSIGAVVETVTDYTGGGSFTAPISLPNGTLKDGTISDQKGSSYTANYSEPLTPQQIVDWQNFINSVIPFGANTSWGLVGIQKYSFLTQSLQVWGHQLDSILLITEMVPPNVDPINPTQPFTFTKG